MRPLAERKMVRFTSEQMGIKKYLYWLVGSSGMPHLHQCPSHHHLQPEHLLLAQCLPAKAYAFSYSWKPFQLGLSSPQRAVTWAAQSPAPTEGPAIYLMSREWEGNQGHRHASSPVQDRRGATYHEAGDIWPLLPKKQRDSRTGTYRGHNPQTTQTGRNSLGLGVRFSGFY